MIKISSESNLSPMPITFSSFDDFPYDSRFHQTSTTNIRSMPTFDDQLSFQLETRCLITSIIDHHPPTGFVHSFDFFQLILAIGHLTRSAPMTTTTSSPLKTVGKKLLFFSKIDILEKSLFVPKPYRPESKKPETKPPTTP